MQLELENRSRSRDISRVSAHYWLLMARMGESEELLDKTCIEHEASGAAKDAINKCLNSMQRRLFLSVRKHKACF